MDHAVVATKWRLGMGRIAWVSNYGGRIDDGHRGRTGPAGPDGVG